MCLSIEREGMMEINVNGCTFVGTDDLNMIHFDESKVTLKDLTIIRTDLLKKIIPDFEDVCRAYLNREAENSEKQAP